MPYKRQTEGIGTMCDKIELNTPQLKLEALVVRANHSIEMKVELKEEFDESDDTF